MATKTERIGSFLRMIVSDSTMIAFGTYDPEVSIKAAELLAAHLTNEQIFSIWHHKKFRVIGGVTKSKYYIEVKGHFSYNILTRNRNNSGYDVLCFRPHNYQELSYYDFILTQKIMLENFEMEAISVLNIYPRIIPFIYEVKPDFVDQIEKEGVPVLDI